MNVRDVMTRDPYAANATSTILEVMRMLVEADVRHIPVVHQGALVGIVSDRDLRTIVPTFFDESEQSALAQRSLSEAVSTVMSSDVISVYPDSELTDAVDLMIEHKIGAVPVVEADSSKLVGIVSYIDALRAARDLL